MLLLLLIHGTRSRNEIHTNSAILQSEMELSTRSVLPLRAYSEYKHAGGVRIISCTPSAIE